MPLRFGIRAFAFLTFACFTCASAVPQSSEMLWTKDFPKSITWYMRTTAGILLVRSGKYLTAVDPGNGRELWQLADPSDDYPPINFYEVPGMGILLVNYVKLPGQAGLRLVALNLFTGEHLWDQRQNEELITGVPLPGSNEIVLVSARVQKKIVVAEAVAATAVSATLHVPIFMNLMPVPFRFELTRMNPLTGKATWAAEYPHTFQGGVLNAVAYDDHLFLSIANSVLGCVDLANGNRLWEASSKRILGTPAPIPVDMAYGNLIYAQKNVQAVDPTTDKPVWQIEGLGRLYGVALQDGLVAAIGTDHLAAVDAKTGAERWRKKVHGTPTNLLWDKSSGSLIYADGKALHQVELSTGKSLHDSPLRGIDHPSYAFLAGPSDVVLMAPEQASLYDFKTGKNLLTSAKLSGYFRSTTVQYHWLMPDGSQAIMPVVVNSSDQPDSPFPPEGTLLPENILVEMASASHLPVDELDSFETSTQPGDFLTWWIDPQTNRQVSFHLSGDLHDVSRTASTVIAITGNQLWAATLNPHSR